MPTQRAEKSSKHDWPDGLWLPAKIPTEKVRLHVPGLERLCLTVQAFAAALTIHLKLHHEAFHQ
jgi:hypothetical protein